MRLLGRGGVLLGQRGDLLDPDHRTERVLRRGVRLEDPAQRHDHHEQIEDEGDQLGDLHRAVGHQVAADAEHQDERALQGDSDDRRDQRHHLGQPDAGRIGVAGHGVQFVVLPLGRTRRTDRPDSRHGPADTGGQHADLGLRRQGQALDAAAQPDHHTNGDGDDDQRQAQQQRADQGHRDHRPHEDQHPGHGIDQPRGDHRAQQRGVGADPGDQVAGAPGVELGDRQPEQPVHQQPPGVQHHALGRALQQVALDPVDRPPRPIPARPAASPRRSAGARPARR